jgi:hypothetical protein
MIEVYRSHLQGHRGRKDEKIDEPASIPVWRLVVLAKLCAG